MIATLLAAWLMFQSSASIHIGGINMPFSLPAGVVGLQCIDATGAPKTAFTGHGDTAICTLTLAAPAPATGFQVTPYSADAPLVLNPPAASGLTVPAGNSTWKFTVTYP